MNGGIVLDWRLFLFTFLFVGGGFVHAFITRHLTHSHAFRGMSKTKKKKIIKSQSKLSYILMTYTLKYNSSIRTWWCLIFYWAFLISDISAISIAWISVFVEIPIPPIVINIIFSLAGLSPAFVAFSFLLPLRTQNTNKKFR